MTRQINIVGASARAAAFSAYQAGFNVWAADRFGDADLRNLCPAETVQPYPEGLAQALAMSPDAPWMYTGALENYPDLLEELETIRHLYGNRASVVRQVRDPAVWTDVLRSAGLATPAIALAESKVPRDGTWLLKRRNSAGGFQIQRWTAEGQIPVENEGHAENGWFFQEYIPGQAISGVFVAAEGDAVLLGVTEQILRGQEKQTDSDSGASSELADTEFQYVGSIGPLLLAPEIFRRFQAIGQQLSRELRLIGLFGVDAVLTDRDVIAIEINPRYTASIEVLERASAQRTSVRRSHRLLSIDWHEAACCFRTLPAPVGQSAERCSGKKIIFATRDGTFAAAARWVLEQNLTVSQPAAVDIPAAGTTIQPGQPILTLLADGSDAASVQGELRRLEASLVSVLPIAGAR